MCSAASDRWTNFRAANRTAAVILLLAAGAGPAPADDAPPLQVGSRFSLLGAQATVRTLDTLPVVENDYTQRFRFDSFENPKLKELRERYRLDEVVAPGRDEFARQVRLMDWTHRQFKKFGRPSTNCHGAMAILGAVEGGHTFFCAHYVEVLVSAAASLGWVDRSLALRRHQGVNRVGGSTEHSVTEIWSNQHRKWVMLDPTSNLYLETNGVPLNAWEIRQEWFYHAGSNLVFVVGRDGRHLRKGDLPIVLGSFPNFGELAVHPDELDKYGFIGYIPNTDLMTSGYDYARMFITKDALCDGTPWHVRTLPAHPAVDPYFPIGQADLRLTADPASRTIRAALRTMTPNFLRYEVRIDGRPWQPADATLGWPIHPGENRFEARTVNKFGVPGPLSMAVIDADQ